MAHFWPDYRIWMWDLTDTREQEAITYGRVFLTWQSLMLFLQHVQPCIDVRTGQSFVAHTREHFRRSNSVQLK